jgi:hypothetical protein
MVVKPIYGKLLSHGQPCYRGDMRRYALPSVGDEYPISGQVWLNCLQDPRERDSFNEKWRPFGKKTKILKRSETFDA